VYAKIEPSGTCERKGLVQIRLCFYLDKDDYGYEKHHILIDKETYQDNPFHNHFIYVEPDTSNKEIMTLAEAYLHEAGVKWSTGEKIDCKNYGVSFYQNVSKDRLTACADKVSTVKAITTEVKI